MPGSTSEKSCFLGMEGHGLDGCEDGCCPSVNVDLSKGHGLE